jgi:hypothetical protein
MCPQNYTLASERRDRAEHRSHHPDRGFQFAAAAKRCWCAGKAQAEAADLRRVGMVLCAASSLMTVGSALTVAMLLL